jgi:small-conductance mechanosensitive channel
MPTRNSVTVGRFSKIRGWLIATAVAGILLEPVMFRANAQTGGADQDTLLAHLNAVINWYKKLTTDVPPGSEPSDTIYATNAQNLAAQVVRLAFQSARAQAELIARSNASSGSQNAQQGDNNAASPQRYAQMDSEAAERVNDDQASIKALKANPRAKGNVAEQVQALEGKLALDQATLGAIRSLKKFVEASSSGGTSLERNINELARSVPEVFDSLEGEGKPAAPANVKSQTNSNSGLLGQLMVLYREMLSLRSIEQRLSENDEIQKVANNLRTPLRQKLSETLQQGRALSGQPNVPRTQYDALTEQFKQLSAGLLPLSEEVLVLDQSRSNLLNWRSAHAAESRGLLIAILLRVGVILIALGIIFAIAEAWRRLTFRYVHDPRRRRQFLVLRRFLMGFFMCTVIVMGFVSEFSSLATFAGFVTAGIAVGLQTVLLSVAAYFFVIGRYGIRIGDRITIAGVTGDVVDLGLVRFYVMEYAPSGPDVFPTGRVVVFSNSVLFQPTTPLYKQLPGTHYTWHEAVLPLATGADWEAVQKSVNDAVQSVFREYSRQAEWQRALDYGMEITMRPPAPEQRLQFGDSGIELVVRYPVDLHRAPEVDAKVTEVLLETMAKDGVISKGISGTPKIRTAVKV